MASFDCDSIMYSEGDHKTVEEEKKKSDAYKIAEAVVVWGLSDNFDDFDDSADENWDLDLLNTIVLAVINFSSVFEFEFEQVFANHCNEGMTEDQFKNFVRTRCNLLGNIEGYFGYIMPCAFVRETIFRFKNHFECSHFCIFAQECLEEFLEEKFKEFNNGRSLKEFLAYCNGINDQFLKNLPSHALFSDESSNRDLCKEPTSTTENADLIVKSAEEKNAKEFFKSHDTANDAISKLVAYRADSVDTSVHINSENFNLDKLSYGTSVSRTKSDAILDLSKAIYKMCLEDENELCKTEANDTIDSDSTGTDEDKEFDVMYSILMPEEEFIEEVFSRIEDCFDKSTDEGNVPNLDKSSGLKSDNANEYLNNKSTPSISTKNENGDVETPVDNRNLFTKEPYSRRYCNLCNSDVRNPQNHILIT